MKRFLVIILVLVCAGAWAAPRYMPDGIEVGGSGSGYNGSGGGADITSAGAINADGNIQGDGNLEVEGTITAGTSHTVHTNADGTIKGAAIEAGIGGTALTLTTGVLNHDTGNGVNHVPADGASGQALLYSSAGTAAWGTVDVSASTNLAATTPIVLTGDTLSHATTAGSVHIPTAGATGNVLEYGGSSGTAAWATKLGVNEWEYTGNLTIDAINAAADSTVNVGNSAATYQADLSVDGDVTAGEQIFAANGTVSLPAYSFTNEPDCGLYYIGADNWGAAANGAKVLDIATTGLTVTGNATATKLLSTELEFTGNMTLDAINAAADSTVTVQNSAATYEANLGLDGDLAVGGDVTLSKANVAIGAANGGTLTLGAEGTTNGAIVMHTSSSSPEYVKLYADNVNDDDTNYWVFTNDSGQFQIQGKEGTAGLGMVMSISPDTGYVTFSKSLFAAQDLIISGGDLQTPSNTSLTIAPQGTGDLNLTPAGGDTNVTGTVTTTTDAASGYLYVKSYSDTATDASNLILSNARGTLATPTATQSGDYIAKITVQGWDTAMSGGAQIRFDAAAEWGTAGDTTDNPTDILFFTVADGSSTLTERMRIASTGAITTTGASITLDTGSVTTTAGSLITGTGYAGTGATITAAGVIQTDSSITTGDDLTVTDDASVGGNFSRGQGLFTADDTSPSVNSNDIWVIPDTWTAGHNITSFDDEEAGTVYYIIGGDADCVITDGGELAYMDGNWTATPGHTLTLIYCGAIYGWRECGRVEL